MRIANPQIRGLTGQTYQSYLIRFWQSSKQGEWHASAQCIQNGNTVLFGTIEELLTFLQSETSVERESRRDTTSSQTEQHTIAHPFTHKGEQR